MRTPTITFRFNAQVLDALDALVDHSGGNRSDVVRRLILDEHARTGLGQEAATKFVDRLIDRFGDDARLRFEMGLTGDPRSRDVNLSVDSEPVTDLQAIAVFDIDDIAVIYLGDPDSTVRLQVGSVPAFGGAIEVPIGSLKKAPLGWEAR